MRVRDPTRKSLLEFRGPVFPIDVTGQELTHYQGRIQSQWYRVKPAGDAERQVPGYE